MRKTILLLTLAACGGSTPAPKAEDPSSAPTPTSAQPRRGNAGGMPSVSQELGSIDEGAVQKTFDRLQTKLEVCHEQGRRKVEFLSGDVKVFLRVGQDGRVRYGYLEGSTIGDRETESCILDVFSRADWPKPQGGEAEVRNGFGWSAGGERQPAAWPAEKALNALGPDDRKAIDECKAGASGTYKVTGYVEPGEVEAPAAEVADPWKKTGGKTAQRPSGKAPPPAPKEPGGKFKAIGIAVPGKDAAAKADCIVDALRNVALPSPGSYAAKVTFTL